LEAVEGGLFTESFLAAFAVEFFLSGKDRGVISHAHALLPWLVKNIQQE
jgi:hypothetical protein